MLKDFKSLIIEKIFFFVSLDPKNIKTKFLQFFLTLNNGGLTAIESIYLRKPAFILPQSKHEKSFINSINKKNIFLGINLKSFYFPSKKELLSKFTKKNNIIDGKGMSRIEKLILNV